MDPSESLRRFRDEGCQRSFGEFVVAHSPLVWSVALRQCGGHRETAEEVVQAVFTDVARMIRRLDLSSSLAGWLVRHTCLKSLATHRAERRRLQREDKAYQLHHAPPGPDPMTRPEPFEYAPLVDEILTRLSSDDRQALVLRFYENRDLKHLGESLGIGEEAARKRVSRALERLRIMLARRGVLTSSALLSTGLQASAVQPFPDGLASRVAARALRDGIPPVTAWAAWKTAAWASIARSPGLAAVAAAALTAAVALPLYQHTQYQKNPPASLAAIPPGSLSPTGPQSASRPGPRNPASATPAPAVSDPLMAALATMISDSASDSVLERMISEIDARWADALSLTEDQRRSLRQWMVTAFETQRSQVLTLLKKPEVARALRQQAAGQEPDAADLAMLKEFAAGMTSSPNALAGEKSWADQNLTPEQSLTAAARLTDLRTTAAEAIAGQRLAALTSLATLGEDQKTQAFQFYARDALSGGPVLPEEQMAMFSAAPRDEPAALLAEEAFLQPLLSPEDFAKWKARPLPLIGPAK